MWINGYQLGQLEFHQSTFQTGVVLTGIGVILAPADMTHWKTPQRILDMRNEGKPLLRTRRFFVLKAALKRSIGAPRKGHWLTSTVTTFYNVVKSAPGAIAGAITLFTFLSSFASITASGIASEPILDRLFLVPFTITNTSSIFTLRDITANCWVNHVRFDSQNQFDGNLLLNQQLLIPVLLSGSQDSINCPTARSIQIPWHVNSADLTILLQYRLAVVVPILDWTIPLPSFHSSQIRFITVTTPDRLLRWVPYGLDRYPRAFAVPSDAARN